MIITEVIIYKIAFSGDRMVALNGTPDPDFIRTFFGKNRAPDCDENPVFPEQIRSLGQLVSSHRSLAIYNYHPINTIPY